METITFHEKIKISWEAFLCHEKEGNRINAYEMVKLIEEKL
ncbi:hypothetical protein [Clostridium beijerinckii]|nr:hypothetical protein [Clostridium beijerinckii]MBA8933614.1 hypothetical protein [Clostridium beijerinckii]NOW05454.1 hypothetical protein [Clostridium beijerinckii]NRU37813.1 hypothetical protein [Clostridium beijerinckii]NSA98909.1 hypothetical protein [Clostridium beijerinckii]NYC01402.1 hypothetical protein [Clostridium beijerinckii]